MKARNKNLGSSLTSEGEFRQIKITSPVYFGNAIMGMEGYKITELTVYDPTGRAVDVFALCVQM